MSRTFPLYLYTPDRIPDWVEDKIRAAGTEAGQRDAYARAALVLSYLGKRAGHRAHIKVRQSFMAEKLGVSERTVKRAIQILKDLDLVVVQRTRRTAIYRLKFHPRYGDEMIEYLDRKEAKAAREAAPPAVEVEVVEVEAPEVEAVEVEVVEDQVPEVELDEVTARGLAACRDALARADARRDQGHARAG